MPRMGEKFTSDLTWEQQYGIESVCAKEEAVSIPIDQTGLRVSTREVRLLGKLIHEIENAKWWVDLYTGEPLVERNVGELLMLTVSELAEAMKGHRQNLMDDHLLHRKMFEVELADCIIRVLDIGEGLGLDVAEAIYEKILFNRDRSDHTREARLAPNGKKY